MNAHTYKDLQHKFRRIGSDFQVEHNPWRRQWMIDVQQERFIYHDAPAAESGSGQPQLKVTDVNRDIKHLFLEVVPPNNARSKFLCGHDERHYFIAGTPLRAHDIDSARLLLVPDQIRQQVAQMPLKHRFDRHNEVYKRQGEWFFVPVDDQTAARLDDLQHYKNEPIRRGRSKPHYCATLARMGGTYVYVHATLAPNGVSQAERDRLIAEANAARQQGAKLYGVPAQIGWRGMQRDAKVFAHGKVKHPDHQTLLLYGWHEVLMSNEVLSERMAFLD